MNAPISPKELPSFTVGFELEYIWPPVDVAARDIPTDFGTVKYDSYVDDGFELESCVFDREDFTAHTNNLKAQWEELFSRFSHIGAEAADYAGHHIHVDFKALSPEQIHAVARLIAANKLIASTIAERDYSLQVQSIQNLAEHRGGRAFVHTCTQHEHDHSVHTIEFRMFQTQDNLDGFLKNMQYVISVCDFIRGNNFPLEECGSTAAVKAHIQFVSDNADLYPQLNDFMQAHGYFNSLFVDENNSMIIEEFPSLAVEKKFRELITNLRKTSPVAPYVQRTMFSNINTRYFDAKRAPKTQEFIQQVIATATAQNRLFISIAAPKKAPAIERPLQPVFQVVK